MMMNREMDHEFHSVPIDECIDDLLTRNERNGLTSPSAKPLANITSGRAVNYSEASTHLRKPFDVRVQTQIKLCSSTARSCGAGDI